MSFFASPMASYVRTLNVFSGHAMSDSQVAALLCAMCTVLAGLMFLAYGLMGLFL